MRNKSVFYLGSAALVISALIAACDKAPTAPTAPTVQGPTAGPQAGTTPTRVEIAAPEIVAPLETAQLRATAFYADGSTRDVTSASTWSTRQPSILSISSAGVATAGDLGGTALVEALFAGRNGTKYVMVLPMGTFKLTGTVYESGIPVSGAQVAVSAGIGAGLATTTGDGGTSPGGSYALYGVATDSEIRVTKPGYAEQKTRLQGNQSLHFELVPSAPRETVDGIYALTIAAAHECRSQLPAELLERTYSVFLTQAGPRLTATLQGTTFYTAGTRRYNTFQAVLEPERITFGLQRASFQEGDDWWPSFSWFPDVFDLLTASTYYSVSGSVALSGSGSRRSGTLNGVIETLGGPPTFTGINACESSSHRVDLTR